MVFVAAGTAHAVMAPETNDRLYVENRWGQLPVRKPTSISLGKSHTINGVWYPSFTPLDHCERLTMKK
jgi:hypothetical protein